MYKEATCNIGCIWIWNGVAEQGTQGAAATREYRFLLLGDHLALLASGRRRHVQVSVTIRVSIALLT
jgi:hypothetical protein